MPPSGRQTRSRTGRRRSARASRTAHGRHASMSVPRARPRRSVRLAKATPGRAHPARPAELRVVRRSSSIACELGDECRDGSSPRSAGRRSCPSGRRSARAGRRHIRRDGIVEPRYRPVPVPETHRADSRVSDHGRACRCATRSRLAISCPSRLRARRVGRPTDGRQVVERPHARSPAYESPEGQLAGRLDRPDALVLRRSARVRTRAVTRHVGDDLDEVARSATTRTRSATSTASAGLSIQNQTPGRAGHRARSGLAVVLEVRELVPTRRLKALSAGAHMEEAQQARP